MKITFFFPLETECHNLDQTDPEYRRYGQDRQVNGERKEDVASEGIVTHLGPWWLSHCKTGPHAPLGQTRELISLWSQFYFVCELVILINCISFLRSVNNSKEAEETNDFFDRKEGQ